MQQTTINQKVKIIGDDDMIFRYVAINNCTLGPETVKKMTEVGDTWCHERLCANLIDIRNTMFTDYKTRAYTAAQCRSHVAGTAILTESTISGYFANIHLKSGRSKTTTRLFTKEDEAVK
jgi:hypothetical protein